MTSPGGSPAPGRQHIQDQPPPSPPSARSAAFRASARGSTTPARIVGASLASHAQDGFLYSSQTLHLITPFGSDRRRGPAQSTLSGQIAGQASTPPPERNWLTSTPTAASPASAALPGDVSSYASAHQLRAGQVAGVSYGVDGIGGAFLYSAGKMQIHRHARRPCEPGLRHQRRRHRCRLIHHHRRSRCPCLLLVQRQDHQPRHARRTKQLRLCHQQLRPDHRHSCRLHPQARSTPSSKPTA